MVGRGSFGRTKKGVWLRDKQLRGAGECLANVGGRKNLANSRNEDIILQSSRSSEAQKEKSKCPENILLGSLSLTDPVVLSCPPCRRPLSAADRQ